jgi:hypothetical protein
MDVFPQIMKCTLPEIFTSVTIACVAGGFKGWGWGAQPLKPPATQASVTMEIHGWKRKMHVSTIYRFTNFIYVKFM